jgi:CRP-like cAMP-binding protein
LPEAERIALKSLPFHEATFSAGDEIIPEGSTPTTSSLLVSGLVARMQLLSHGSRQICAFHVPGDFIDLHSFLLNQMDHGVEAMSQVRLLQVPHSALRTLTEEQPHLARLLWLLTLIDAAMHRTWIASIGKRHGAERLAHLICEMFMRMEAVGLVDGHSFEFPVTQADLGDALGFSVVHTNRMIKELRTSGLISWSGRIVEILDRGALEELAEFDPSYLNFGQKPR